LQPVVGDIEHLGFRGAQSDYACATKAGHDHEKHSESANEFGAN
jgi:hypothetical protein